MNTLPLTSLRFIAAIIVVIFHYGSNTQFAQLAHGFLTAGQSMVIFFFVLSGFVMTLSYGKKENFSSRDYWVARFARITPIYFFALLLAVYITLSPSIEDGWTYGGDIHTGILLNATFLQAWFPPYPLSINTPAWSLSTEVFFYATFPLIIVFLRKIEPSIRSVAIFSLTLYAITQAALMNLHSSDLFQMPPSKIYDLIYFFPLFHVGTFLIGVAAGYFVISTDLTKLQFRYALVLPALTLGCIGLIVFILSHRDYLMSLLGYESSLLAPLYALLFVLIIQTHNLVAVPFRSKLFVLLGDCSYSIYILQDPMHDLFNKFVQPYMLGVSGVNADFQFYLYTLLLVLVSILTFYVIEKPAKRLIINWYSKYHRSIQKLSLSTP